MPETTAVTCPGCASPQPDSARWCGRCGDPLRAAPTPAWVDHDPDGPPAPPAPGAGDAPRWEGDLPDLDAVTGDGWVALAAGEVAPPTVVEDTLPAPDHRRRVLAGVLVLLVLAALVTVQTLRDPQLPELGMSTRGDAGRSGVSTAVTPPVPTTSLWQAEVEVPSPVPAGTVVLTSAPAVVTVDTVGGSGLVGYDGVTGAFRWQRADLPGLLADPVELTEDGRHVVVPTLAATIVLDAATGQERWRRAPRLDDVEVLPAGIASVAQGPLTLLDPATGEPRLEGLRAVTVLPAGSRDRLLLVDDGPDLTPEEEAALPDEDRVLAIAPGVRVVDVATGDTLVRVPLVDPAMDAGDPRLGTTPGLTVAADDRAIAVVGPVSVTTWDLTTGERVGTVEHGLGEVRSIAVTVGRPALADRNGDVRVLEPDTGAVRWTLAASAIDPERTLTAPPMLRSTGRVLQVSAPGTVVVVDGLTGDVTNRAVLAPDERRLLSADASIARFAADGTLTVTTADGRERFTTTPVLPAAPAPAVRDGRVAVATREGVAVLDLTTGQRIWENASFLGSRAHHGALRQPAVTDDQVVLSPPDAEPHLSGGLVGFEVDTGILVWRREDDVPVRGELTLDRDLVFLPVDRELHGYEADAGRRGLAARAGGRRVAVAAGGGLLVATTPGSDDGVVSAVLRADRSRAWTVQRPVCSPPAVRGGRVVVGAPDGVAALDLATGAEVWRADVAPVCAPPAVDDEVVVVTTGPAQLTGLGAADGSARWQASLPAPAVGAPVLAGRTAVVSLLDGTLVGVDTTAGALLWQRDLPAVPAGPPTVTDTGAVLVTLRDGRVVADGTPVPAPGA
ncbi:MAG: PQQ-binding-like beta-propeller repeat protein [Actinomycetes bacterium]